MYRPTIQVPHHLSIPEGLSVNLVQPVGIRPPEPVKGRGELREVTGRLLERCPKHLTTLQAAVCALAEHGGDLGVKGREAESSKRSSLMQKGPSKDLAASSGSFFRHISSIAQQGRTDKAGNEKMNDGSPRGLHRPGE